ncbi:MAG: hypothetical protein IPG25_17775 [Proteobacteria bacterium]|nr:hypothetical protein [Pseudomonadota bacterium]
MFYRLGEVAEDRLAAIVTAGSAARNGWSSVNQRSAASPYLEISNRDPEDGAHYPDVDMDLPTRTGGFRRKDGTLY